MRNEIGKRIAELRKSFGMNQEELAEKLNVTFQAVSKWETGATYPDIELLSMISECFHVSVDYLLKGNELKSRNYYDQRYNQDEYYWGYQPSIMCYKVLQQMPPLKHLRLLDVGCGEGKDAVFFARNGYDVTAFDLAETGIEKTKRLAERCGVYVNAFTADVNEFRLDTEFDIIYSNGVLHYIPIELRGEIFNNYKKFTAENGINTLSAFVKKPFVNPAPETEKYSYGWLSGELFMLYHDWSIDLCEEVVFDCMSSGIPHKHAMNRVLAKKIEKHDWQRIIYDMKDNTNHNGLNIVGIFTNKLPATPDNTPFTKALFDEGELKELYVDWNIIEFNAYVFEDEHPGGIRHKHAANNIIAKK